MIFSATKLVIYNKHTKFPQIDRAEKEGETGTEVVSASLVSFPASLLASTVFPTGL